MYNVKFLVLYYGAELNAQASSGIVRSMQLHHAVVFEGDIRAGEEAALRFVVEMLGLRVDKNPDVSVVRFEQLTIDDARKLKDRAMQAPLGERQVFVLIFDKIVIQAQHALLKLLEEPAKNTHLVLVLPELAQLLPTVQSRLAYGGRLHGEPAERALAEEFLAAEPKKRVKLVQHLYTNVKEPQKIPYRNKARVIVEALEHELYTRGVREQAAALHEVVSVRRYLTDPSSSLKMLLEHLAYTLPRT